MNTPLVLSIPEAARAVGLGRTSLYEAIRCGKLNARKHGRRTLILVTDLQAWVSDLPLAARSRS